MIVDALACYRLVRLVQQDTIFARPRAWILGRAPGPIVELLDCPWCLSIWTAAGVTVARRTVPRAWGPIATVLALSAVTGIVSERT